MDARRELIKTRLKVFVAKKKDPELTAALTPEICSDLVEKLLDGTVFAILDSLRDLQAFKEKELFDERQHRLEQIQATTGEAGDGELIEFDKRIVRELDELVTEQQNHLACAHIPLFRTTQSSDEVCIQMAVCEFILSLDSIFPK